MSRLLRYGTVVVYTNGWFLQYRNPFDVAGARNCGFQAFWVDRAGTGWVDRVTALKPSKVVRGLAEIAQSFSG